MSSFDHQHLTRDINNALRPFRQSQSGTMQAFAQLAQASMAEGAISAKHKELIALAIGVTQRCDGCIGFHAKALKDLGATRDEIAEVMAMCVYMGGGPALMYAADALRAFDQFAEAA